MIKLIENEHNHVFYKDIQDNETKLVEARIKISGVSINQYP